MAAVAVIIESSLVLQQERLHLTGGARLALENHPHGGESVDW